MTQYLSLVIAVFLPSLLCAQVPGQPAPSGPARTSFSVSAGPALPVGNFAALGGGAAKTGTAISAQVALGGSTAWVSGITLTYNPTDVTAFPAGSQVSANPWWSIWPMSGIRITTEASDGVSIELSGQIGLFVGMSPAATVHSALGDATISSDQAVTVSGGGGAGVVLGGHYALGVHYLFADPGYDVTIVDSGITSSEHLHQPTGIFMFTLGWNW